MLEPGSILQQRYQIEKLLHEGDSRSVYGVIDRQRNRRILLEYDLKEAVEGAEAATSIDSGVITDCFSEAGCAYVVLAMQVEGQTLREFLAGRAALSMEHALAYLTCVMERAARLHALGLSHANITPDTIFLADSGEVLLLGNAHFPSASGRDGVWRDVRDICQVLWEIADADTVTETQREILVRGCEEKAREHIESAEALLAAFAAPELPTSQKAIKKRRESSLAMSEQSASKRALKRRMLPILVPCVLAVMVLLAAFTVFSVRQDRKKTAEKKPEAQTEQAAEITVPNLSNSTYEEANAEAEAQGLTLNVTKVTESEDGTERVMAQDPEAGEKIKANVPVNITLATTYTTFGEVCGDLDADAESLIGYAFSDSRKKQWKDSFSLYQEKKESAYIPGVILQIAKGDSTETGTPLSLTDPVLKKENVTVMLSKGKTVKEGADTGLSVEDLYGESFEEALALAEKKDFFIGNSEKEKFTTYKTALRGQVAAVRMDEKTAEKSRAIKTGDALWLVKSKGPERTTFGKKKKTITEKDGRAQTTSLNGYGFAKLKELFKDQSMSVATSREYNSSVSAGKVIRTEFSCKYDEEAGEIAESEQGYVHKGDAVTIVVSLGAKPTPTTQKKRTRTPSTGGSTKSSGGSSKGSSSGGSSGGSGSKSGGSGGGNSSGGSTKWKNNLWKE